MITVELLLLLLLLLSNAFLAFSELVLLSASKPRLRELEKQGSWRAKQALQLAEDAGRYLSTTQMGITLIGIAVGTLIGAALAKQLAPTLNAVPFIAPHGEQWALCLAVVLFTFLFVVLGELVPKQLALAHADQLVWWVVPPMAALVWAGTPLIWTLERSANALCQLFRIPKTAEKVTEAEVKAIFAQGAASGAIEKSEHEMLNRIIRLGDREVKAIMTHRGDITFIHLQDSLADIRDKILQSGNTRYPIMAEDHTHVLGIVHAKDLLTALLAQLGQTPVAQANTDQIRIADFLKPVPLLAENTNCLAVLELFKTSAAHVAIVVDKYDAVVGLVTTSDILEAIVGMLPSNYGADAEPFIVTREDGSWLVDGMTSIDELHLTLGLEEIETNSHYETIAGFLLFKMDRTPAVGEYCIHQGYRFEVVDLDGHRIDKILIEKIPTTEPDQASTP